MNAIDTNIWFYTHDQRDPRKQKIAIDVVSHTRPIALLWQIGCEFLAATRKLEPQGFLRADALVAFADMQSMADVILYPTAQVWTRALTMQTRFGLSWWDSLLAAACIEGGVKTLATEDFGNLKSIDGLEIVNPFL